MTALKLFAFALLLAACDHADPTAASQEGRRYACEEAGVEFTAFFFGDSVVVRLGEQEYHLEKRPSSIGARYGSDGVSLFIDGDWAVLVGSDGDRLRDCRRMAS